MLVHQMYKYLQPVIMKQNKFYSLRLHEWAAPTIMSTANQVCLNKPITLTGLRKRSLLYVQYIIDTSKF